MGDLKIEISQKRGEAMCISIDGNGADILNGLAIAAIEVTANMDLKNAKVLRGMLCDMIMSAPTNGDNNG